MRQCLDMAITLKGLIIVFIKKAVVGMHTYVSLVEPALGFRLSETAG